MDRRLREVAQLRKLWRAFREPQERLEDERFSRAIIHDRSEGLHVREPLAFYGRDAIRSAIRRWWCSKEYARIVDLSARLDPKLFEEEPVIGIYMEEAKARLAGDTQLGRKPLL